MTDSPFGKSPTEHKVAELVVGTAQEMHQLGLSLASVLHAGDLVILTGPLGAGKTTLTRGIGEGLNVVGNVSSPTFVIARTHHTADPELALVHVDAYRLSSPEEFDDLAIDYPKSVVLVEWGRGFTEGIAANWLEVEIERDHTGSSEERQVRITAFGDENFAMRFKDVHA